ncbi:hypothetical protein [Geothrix oryzisoli]|uniref:hypothetical protein n=1 Tax=Geothrix oryzisoli TaxID=2922721 RepID=UPI001FAC114C|nr:hypothetical protein [Geothrix oryzisoli]
MNWKLVRVSFCLGALIAVIDCHGDLTSQKALRAPEFIISPKMVSLTAGSQLHLSANLHNAQIDWSSNSSYVTVDADGNIFATQNMAGWWSRAVITAKQAGGGQVASCNVTIVDWTANLSSLEIVATADGPTLWQVLGANGNNLIGSNNTSLLMASADLHPQMILSQWPAAQSLVLKATSFGYILRGTYGIYSSKDLISWTTDLQLPMGCLTSGLDTSYDPSTGNTYVFTVEYSVNENDIHRVWKGTYSPNGQVAWKPVLTFDSITNWRKDPSILDSARHCHVVSVDPYTGHVWVGTGDFDVHCRIFCSVDHGETFQLIGMGTQDWRTISVWFTPKYVYWNMDSNAPESIWRISRSVFDSNGAWPSMTPEISTGYTKPNVAYYVTRSTSQPSWVGQIITLNTSLPLTNDFIARPITDPAYDYRERVITLENGTQWYTMWVKDDNNENVLLMGETPEGLRRDYNGRIFGLKERPDGSCDVQELISFPPATPSTDYRYVNWTPVCQDLDGYIYFNGHNTEHNVYKTKLHWIDNVK